MGQSPFVLDAEIIYPHGPGPFAGAVLVHGSGPQDMDSTIGANTPLRDIAEGLAARGLAVLRYHKRFYQYRYGEGQVTVKEEVIDDAVAALALLKSKARIRPLQIFVIGHSLGAQLTPEIAVLSQPVCGIVLLAPPGRTPRTYIAEQLHYLGYPAESMAAIDKDFEMLESEQGEGVRILGAPGRYWKDLYARDGIGMARKLAKPILILHGDRDYQVNNVDIEIWRKGLFDTGKLRVATIPGANHLFIRGEGRPGPEEYRIPGKVDPIVLEQIADFMKGTSRHCL